MDAPPQNSLLLYSKYSDVCKFFFGLLENSKISELLKLQFLAVDNKEVRKSVKKSALGITHVPCLLIFYANGTVEKYDGNRLFDWFRNITAKFAPLPPPPPKQEMVDEKLRNVEEQELKSVIDSEAEKNRKEYLRRKAIAEEEEPAQPDNDEKTEIMTSPPPEDDVEENIENDQVMARHRKITQPKRLRQNNNSYVEDEDLFPGDPVEIREPRNSVRNVARSITNKGSQEDPHGTMARAKALAQGREEIEHQTANPQKRPFSARRH